MSKSENTYKDRLVWLGFLREQNAKAYDSGRREDITEIEDELRALMADVPSAREYEIEAGVDVARWRVTYGWGAYDDFVELADALEFAAERLREPTHDPLLRRVALLDLCDRDKDGCYRQVVEARCEQLLSIDQGMITRG